MESTLLSDKKELKRRHRERVMIVVTLLMIVLLFLLGGYLTRQGDMLPISSSVLIFGLININIILIILLLFLILRNVIKLFYDQREGVLGSRFRTKIVLAFVGFSLIPTSILFVFAVGFLSYSIDNWFNIKIGDALVASQEVAQDYYEKSFVQAADFSRQISADITKNRLYDQDRRDYLRTLVEQRQRLYEFSHVEVQVANQIRELFVKDRDNPHVVRVKPSAQMSEDLYGGKEVKTVHSTPGGDMIVSMLPIFSYLGNDRVVGTVTASYFVPREVVQRVNVISGASEEYKQLKLLKNPVKLSYIITLSIVALLIVFSATWFGLYLAKNITGTIEYLAEATRRISQGDLNYQIAVEAKDEIGVLVTSFNQMTRELKKSNESLESAYNDLEGRKRYTETVLRNVSTGVVSVDRKGVITTINRAAERMFDINAEAIIGRRYEEVLIQEHLSLVRQILAELSELGNPSLSKQIQLILKGRIITFLMTANIVKDDNGDYTGLVVVFEDVSKIQKEERAAAWREVARRMAHEIKNPLTPVQLAAQRLQRRYGDKLGDDGSVFQECTGTIIKQVDVLKNLVNEFTRYARTPVTNLAMNDLNRAIKEPFVLFRDAHRNIAFHFNEDSSIPAINIDPEQIRGVMINLLDNAVAAVDSVEGSIEITTFYDEAHHKVRVDVADNGRGISPADKMKMFEPYFSTKKSGMGLGLSIVSSIISDHYGHVSVRDNVPYGTVVSFEIPVPEFPRV